MTGDKDKTRKQLLKELKQLDEIYFDPLYDNFKLIKWKKAERKRLLNLLKDGREFGFKIKDMRQKIKDRNTQRKQTQKTEDNLKYTQKTLD